MTTPQRETATAFSAQVVALVSAVLTQSCLAWTLGQADRGSFAVCMTIGTVLGVFFLPGTDRAAQFFLLNGKLSLSESTSGALVFVAAAAGVGLLVGLGGLAMGLAFFENASVVDVVLALVLLVPINLLSITLELQLAALREFRVIATFAALQAIVSLSGVALLTWAFDFGVTGALTATALAGAMTVFFFWRSLAKRQGFALQPVPMPSLVRLVNYGRRYYFARIGHQLDMAAGVLILGTIGSRGDVGLFAAISALVLRVLMLSTTIETVLLPRLASVQEGRVDKLVAACRIAGWLTFLVCIPVALLSKWIVLVLLSPDFLAGQGIVWALVPGVMILGFAGCLMTFFRITDRPQVCSLAVWAGLLTSSILMIVLYPQAGLVGAGVAASMGLLARAGVLLGAFRSVTGTSPLSLFWIPQNLGGHLAGILRR